MQESIQTIVEEQEAEGDRDQGFHEDRRQQEQDNDEEEQGEKQEDEQEDEEEEQVDQNFEETTHRAL